MDSDGVPLREHLEAWQTAHQQVHVEEQRARNEATKRMDGRLEALNELRSEVLTDRNLLVRRDTHDAAMKVIESRIDALHEQVVEWRGRGQGLTLVGQMVLGLVAVASVAAALYFGLAG